ncbi:MAG: hypothetical protein ACM3O7_08190 [Acidobacteriota bacterium]
MTRIGRDRLLLGSVVATALALRVWAAAVRPAWHDEYFTAWVAGLSWRDLLAALRADSGPPLLYALTKVLALTGLDPLVAARAIAVLAGTLAVTLAGRAARTAFGTWAGIACAALLAVHPLALAWSSEGRAYALLLLAAAWGWERLEAIADGQGGHLALAAAVALGCWSHAFGLVLAAALAAAALTLAAAARRGALVAVGAGLISNLPWLPIAVHQPASATAWMIPAWQAMPALDKLLAPVRLLPPLAPFGHQLDLPSAPPVAQLAAAALCAGLLLAGPLHRLPVMLWLIPAFGLSGLALLGVPAFYPGRGEALFLAPFLALLASGAARWRWAAVGVALLVASALAVDLLALRSWAAAPESGAARIARIVEDRLPAGGTVVISGYWRLGISHCLGRKLPRYVLINVPREAALHPGWYDDATDLVVPSEVAGVAERLAAGNRRVAIVVSPGLRSTAVLEALAEGLGLGVALDVPGARLFAPPAGGVP